MRRRRMFDAESKQAPDLLHCSEAACCSVSPSSAAQSQICAKQAGRGMMADFAAVTSCLRQEACRAVGASATHLAASASNQRRYSGAMRHPSRPGPAQGPGVRSTSMTSPRRSTTVRTEVPCQAYGGPSVEIVRRGRGCGATKPAALQVPDTRGVRAQMWLAESPTAFGALCSAHRQS